MMLPTHIIVGMFLSLSVLYIEPNYINSVILVSIFGSLIPDLDMYYGHRKTLHYPVFCSIATLLSFCILIFITNIYSISLFFFFMTLSIHPLLDILSSGLEIRPWENTSKKAVYNHYSKQWIAPLHIIPYDGSKEDLSVLLILSIPLMVYLGQPFYSLIIVLNIIGILYTLSRKILPEFIKPVIKIVPDNYRKYIPDRYQE
mgnify:CR=1 FL=1